MKKLTILDLIKVDEYSLTSKYLQIANSIIREIKNENIHLGDNLPSAIHRMFKNKKNAVCMYSTTDKN